MKPDCYQCKYRGKLAGSCHSCCNHPANNEAMNNPLAQIFGIFASVGRTPPIQGKTILKIKGNPHGITHGWFNYPFNFDPVWLEECDGFEAKDIIHKGEKKGA